MIAVFDTNILFSAVGWRGPPHQCVQLARGGGCQLILCREILDELQEKLVIKRQLPPMNAAEIIEEFLTFARVVKIEGTIRQVMADPDDDMVLECAAIGGADCIVSGDHHLLDLRSWRGMEILAAAQFLARNTSHA